MFQHSPYKSVEYVVFVDRSVQAIAELVKVCLDIFPADMCRYRPEPGFQVAYHRVDLVEIYARYAFGRSDIVFPLHPVVPFPTIGPYFRAHIDMALEDRFQFLSRIVVDGHGVEPFYPILVGKFHRTDYLFLFGIVAATLFALFPAPSRR